MLLVRYRKLEGVGGRGMEIVSVENLSDVPPDMSDPVNVVNAMYGMGNPGWDRDPEEIVAIYKAAIDNCVKEKGYARVRVANGEIARLKRFIQWIHDSKYRPFYIGSLDEMEAMARTAGYVSQQIDRHYRSDPAEVAAEEECVLQRQREKEVAQAKAIAVARFYLCAKVAMALLVVALVIAGMYWLFF